MKVRNNITMKLETKIQTLYQKVNFKGWMLLTPPFKFVTSAMNLNMQNKAFMFYRRWDFFIWMCGSFCYLLFETGNCIN